MRKRLAFGFFLVWAFGIATGLIIANKLGYEYHLLTDADEPTVLVNQQGWEPVAGYNVPGIRVYRRAKLRW